MSGLPPLGLPSAPERGSYSRTRWVVVGNNHAETIPPFGCMELQTIQALGDQLAYIVTRPTGNQQTSLHLFNGPIAIRSGRYGQGTQDLPAIALVDSLSYGIGDLIGPTSGQWSLGNTGANYGFQVMGALSDFYAVVQRSPQSFAAATIDAIPARDGTTAGSGQVTLYYHNSVTLTSYAKTIYALNDSSGAVTAAAYIHVKIDAFGRALVDFEDCPEE